jgi:hypothetical protein
MGVRSTLAISVILWLPAAALMANAMLEHNFGIVLFGS